MQLEQIISDYKDRIYRIIYLYAFSLDEQKEIYQLVLINLWKSLSSFEGRSSLNTWIYRVAVNTCKMYRRKKFFEKKHSELEDSVFHHANQEGDLIQNEKLDHLYHCLSKLTDQNRLIMSLYLDELSYEEIADIIGISVNLVGVRISRCKEQLRLCLKKNGINHG